MSKLSDFFDRLFAWCKPAKVETDEPFIKEVVTEDTKAPVDTMRNGATASYSNVPKTWKWLLGIDGLPLIVQKGLQEYGTLEGAGTLNNKKIINWADEVAKCKSTPYNNWAADWYNKDSVPWCGLFMAVMACRSANGHADRMPVNNYLTALSWASFGKPVDWKSNRNNIYCGDIAVFTRTGGGHVSIIIGMTKDGQYVACLGGNQSDKVDIKLFSTSRLYAVRRPPYNVKPKGARHIVVSSSGAQISTNEA